MAAQKFEINQLTPIKPNLRVNKFCTYDIEGNNWRNFLMGGFFDGKEYKHFNSLDELAAHMLRKKNCWKVIYAHFGGGYDHRFILDWIWHNRPGLKVKIIEIHGNIIGLNVFTEDKKLHWRFYDSYQVIKGSLDTLTKLFKVEHLKLTGTVDYENMQDTPKTREYLKNDVIGLYEVIEEFYKLPMLQGVGHKMTTSSLALNIYRLRYMKDEWPLYKLPEDKEIFVRKGYYGGRNEIFIMKGRNVREYDINSMYVFAMLNPLPYGSKGTWVKKYPLYNTDICGFIFARVRCPDDMHIPILPYRHKGKLLFPKGEFEGVFFSKELEYAHKLGYKIVEQYKSLIFPAAPILAEYAWSCWQIRQDNPKDPETGQDNPLNMTAKLFGNGIYGKFAQHREREILTQDIDFNEAAESGFKLVMPEYNLWRVPSFDDSPAILPHISAAITAYSRICLHEYLNVYPEKVVYCDTDSVFIEDEELPSGGDLGELKFEGHHKHFIALQPKFYYKESLEGKIKIRAKGFTFEKDTNGKELLPWTKKDFENALDTHNYTVFAQAGKPKLSKLNEAMKAHDLLLVVNRKRSMQTPYSKRVVLENYNTRPLDVDELFNAAYIKLFDDETKVYKKNRVKEFKRLIMQLGGVRPSIDYDELPRWCKRLRGQAIDTMAQELSNNSEFKFDDANALYKMLWEV